jgi:DNA repair protein RadD
MALRDYQQAAFDAAKDWIRSSKESCVIEAATGAGKSHIIAAMAEWLNEKTGKKVLCLAPSAELVQQNHEKFLQTGTPASIYCASISKSLRHDVVFASPKTVINAMGAFCDQFVAVIVDECHGITPTIKKIIADLKDKQKNLRVIGLSATPYRLNDGFIYRYGEDSQPVPEDKTREPYFHQLIYRITAHELIERGFLTKPSVGVVGADCYETDGLQLNKMGNFDAKQVEQTFEGQGRLTSAIVADFVSLSAGRRGVIVFAATVQHAKEIMESLPPENSRIIHGATKQKEREQIIKDYKAMRFKYLVNVSVLTTGFDAPHVDVVVVMRATESVSLMQQIFGRGLRLFNDKKDCLILDYAGNIERHCPSGDIFNPDIKAAYKSEGKVQLEVHCPLCQSMNIFSGRPNPDNFEISADGYFLDLAGKKIIDVETEKEMPAHYGRRCFGQVVSGKNSSRCDYRWSLKECPDCGHENDIAARYCESCKSELVDPNTKLVLEFKRIKSDPHILSTDKVLSWRCQEWQSKSGNTTLRVDYTTEYATFAAWYSPSGKSQRKLWEWSDLCQSVFGEQKATIQEFMDGVDGFAADMPKTVTAKKNRDSGFYEIFGHNKPEDKQP